MKNTILLTLLLGIVFPSMVNGQKSTSTYTVVVGISDYQDEAISELCFAIKDTQTF